MILQVCELQMLLQTEQDDHLFNPIQFICLAPSTIQFQQFKQGKTPF